MSHAKGRSPLQKLIGRLFLALLGWRAEGPLPSVPKAVFVAAPHTSYWDAVIMVAISWALGVRLSFMVKDNVFRRGFSPVVRAFGGIPVNRRERSDMVGQMARAFQAAGSLYLVIAPSGSRRNKSHWKSGFYRIAQSAQVPLLLGYLDYKRKVGGLGPLVEVSGDLRADMDRIRAFYANIAPKHPDRAGEMRLRDEQDSPVL